MRRTLEEHIARIKELSLIKEDLLSTNPNDNSSNNKNTNYNQQDNVEDIMDSPEFEDKLMSTLDNLLSGVNQEIPKLGNQVGDRDGKLVPINTQEEQPNELKKQVESLEINESGTMIALGTALAAPKIIEMIGKGTKQLGKTVKSEWIRSAGEAAANAGKKLHHKYGDGILYMLKKIPKYSKMDEKVQRGIAEGILLSATVAVGITSVIGVVNAIQAGNAGIAAVESGLSGVKGIEVANAAKQVLPNIMNGLFK